MAKKPLDFFDNMKLQGVILPAFPAVSTPTIVPAGALRATVKLLIVIVMNLSGGAISLCNTNVRYRFLEDGNGHPFRCCECLVIDCIFHDIGNVNMASVDQPDPDASVTQGRTLH